MSAPQRVSSFRGDLEGIRGIALVIILFTHLIEWPTGGFVALDVFFVLSGYLITGLLLREYRLTGTISLNGFYRRRIRRLMPSSMLVLVVTALAGLYIFIFSRAVSTLWDALWSVLLVSNWNFALNGTDYFATSLPQSPLLHFWSLSVEEQFYLFWPAIVLALLVLGAGVRHARRRSAGGPQSIRPVVVGIAVIGLLSFGWNLFQSDLNPQVSYLSTLTRIWELAVGALLCFVTPLAQKIPAALRPVLAWAGFAALLVVAFLYTPALHYPGYWCLVPVAATVLIIVAGIGGPSHLVITTNPVSRYLGKISYTSYLWHWPIFIFAGVLFGKESPIYLFASIPVSLAVAALTTRFIEDPIRHSNWLEPQKRSRGHRHHHRHRHHKANRQHGQRVKVSLITAGATLAVALIAVIGIAPQMQKSSIPVASAVGSGVSPTSTAAPGTDTIATEESRLSAAVSAGLNTADWPDDLTPALDKAIDSRAPQWVDDNCLDTSEDNYATCIYGDASLTKTAVLLGDSTAISYMPGLVPALNSLGYRVRTLTHGQCPFANVQVLGQAENGQAAPGFPGFCDDGRAWSIQKTLEIKPDLVVITDGEDQTGAMVVQGDDARLRAMQAGMEDSLTQLSSLTAQFSILASPPHAENVAECATRINHPSDCTSTIDDNWFKLLKVTKDAAASVAAAQNRTVPVIDSSLWVCSERSACPAIAGKTIIRADRTHLTRQFAAGLQDILKLEYQRILGVS
ncbi:hypothetical protein B7R54_11155 [Subtercola boreus]|uniref:Acyltransferase n=1 Tax=Subtercola boreus TaxID=120213 RepID=A0A3E0VIB8_9MICO|nr:acyltransferase family protein [Subtercola boreus]RFA09704.1 hypothetical protein B7R54_11155 [Subtercola boreus]